MKNRTASYQLLRSALALALFSCGGSLDTDGDGASVGEDCDDSLQTGAICTNGCLVFFHDSDGDGHGTIASPATACSKPAGFAELPDDCDDADNGHWGDCASCQDFDDDGFGIDCDLGPDCDDSPESGPSCQSGCTTFYADFDGDGFGTVANPISACGPRSGISQTIGDCAPDNPSHWSDCGLCDDQDGDNRGVNCDLGSADCDETDANSWVVCNGLCFDYDHDGYYSGCDGFSSDKPGPDCNDHDPSIHPGAVDLPDTGIGEDCVDLEPHAVDGDGVYVDANAPDCSAGQGTMTLPFCTLVEALSVTSSSDQAIYLAAGEYGLPMAVVAHGRFFGGYAPTWDRSIEPTTFDVARGAGASDALFHKVTFLGESYEGSHWGLAAHDGLVELIDVVLILPGGPGSCTNVTTGHADLTIVRAEITGSCDQHVGVEVEPFGRRTLIWSTIIDVGAPTSSGRAYGVEVTSELIMGDSTVRAQADVAWGIGTVTVGHGVGAKSELYASSIEAIGSIDARAVVSGATSTVIENALLHAVSSGEARALDAHAVDNIFQSVAIAEGPVAITVDATGGSTQLANNILIADGGTNGAIIKSLEPTVRFYNNNFEARGLGICPFETVTGCVTFASDPAVNTCAPNVCVASEANFEGACGINTAGEISAIDNPCVDSGRDLLGVMAFPIDARRVRRPIDYPSISGSGWDVGRNELTP